MKNTYKIIWTENALSELREIITCLESNWTQKEISRLARKLDKSLGQLQVHPLIYPRTEKSESVRRAVLTRQLTLYYIIDKEYIIILSLFDNRRNPNTKHI